LANNIHYNTVTPLLKSILYELMKAKELEKFRLVGGTSLSLQLGHRLSVDIDLFTDELYGSVDFKNIDAYLRTMFPYVSTSNKELIGMGTSYIIGNSDQDAIKLDLYYTDPFIQDAIIIDNIRMATIQEIVAMKLDVIELGGRKKDFWDIHELITHYEINQMLDLHQERYPYGSNRIEVLKKFVDFSEAEVDFDPICLRYKDWKLIKIDLTGFAKT